jgi:hypothetical protein
MLAVALTLTSALAGRVSAQGLAPVADVDPPTYPFRLGPMLVSPGLRLQQVGFDTNIFIEAEVPREDFVASITPEVNLLLRPRAMRVTGYVGADFNYFQRYAAERYVAPTMRGRVDLLLVRLRPYAAAGRTDTRDRPNREIDARARHLETEVGGGLALELSPQSFAYGSATRSRIDYRPGERFGGVELDRALDKHTTSYDAGVHLSLTPLTSLTVTGGVAQDHFTFDASRNALSRQVSGELAFSADAIFSGTARVGYRDFQPDDPALDPYRGLTARVSLLYPVRDRGSAGVSVLRDVTYSFERAEGYYVETMGDLTYTHRLFGGWDAQLRGAATRMNYSDHASEGTRVDGLRTVGVGGGYTFTDQSRLGLTFEWARRSSNLRPDRRYDRRRLFASWAYTF